MKSLQTEILRTLLYYDIFNHPLTTRELFTFLPTNSMSYDDFMTELPRITGTDIFCSNGVCYVRGRTEEIIRQRREKEGHARAMWFWARFSTHIIKRFPFVRAVFVSGDLSKNATTPKSDVDFVILTEPRRLWIARTLLILFKKTFLFNSKKFFCLNLFATTDHLRLDTENIFIATEVAHLKPLYNSDMFFGYLDANSWVKRFFPNFEPGALFHQKANNRRSLLQRICELPFALLPADALDTLLMERMRKIWSRRYPQFDAATRERLFRSTKNESRAYVGDFEVKILAQYEERLRQHGILN
jgi:hypothetical protein